MVRTVDYGREVGSVFLYHNKVMKVVLAGSKTSPCDGCVFSENQGCNANTTVGYCKSLLRSDKANVIFKRINDYGEVY